VSLFTRVSLVAHFLPRTLLLIAGISVLVLPPSSTSFARMLSHAWDSPATNLDGTAPTAPSAYRIDSGTSGSPYRGSSFQNIAPTRPYGGGQVTSGLTGLVAGTTHIVPFRSGECR
jgi:hypothetical protein